MSSLAVRSISARLGRIMLVVSISVFLLAGGCSWQLGGRNPLPQGVPPPAGDPVPDIETPPAHIQGRPADQLREWSTPRAEKTGIPVIALEAYAYAAKVAERENPRCKIAWTTLAGIGTVESHNGTYHGAVLQPNGDALPPIRGVRLDGSNGNLRLPDTDKGALDGDANQDRAMGPMQFIPETWRIYGVRAAGEGEPSPDNIDDAALSAAGYLCSRGGDLSTTDGWIKALWAYNMSDVYAEQVRDWATAYAKGATL